MHTYAAFSVRVSWVSRYVQLDGACFHGDDPTGDSPQARPPGHDCHGPVGERLGETAVIEKTMFPFQIPCRIGRREWECNIKLYMCNMYG